MRKAVNTIVKGRLYQRGQILTWKYDEKVSLLNDLHVGVVVNFWPKVDPDMTDTWYFHLPSGSAEMMDPKIEYMACAVADLLRVDKSISALILCEAGKTRSVFFATLVMADLLNIDTIQAYKKISKLLPTNKLKPFMANYLNHV